MYKLYLYDGMTYVRMEPDINENEHYKTMPSVQVTPEKFVRFEHDYIRFWNNGYSVPRYSMCSRYGHQTEIRQFLWHVKKFFELNGVKYEYNDSAKRIKLTHGGKLYACYLRH